MSSHRWAGRATAAATAARSRLPPVRPVAPARVARAAAAPAPVAAGALVAPPRRVDLQAHRGGRGLWPENTLTAFAGALALGVHTLELDVGMTRDGVVVVAHDPVVPPHRARGEHVGRPIAALDFAELRTLDVGVPGRPERIPALAEVYALVAGRGARDVRLAVEVKLDPGRPEETAAPDRLTAAALRVAADAGALHRTQVQSFDWRVLQVARELEPAVSRHALAEPRTIFPGTPWTAGAPVPRNAFDGALAEIAHTHLGAAALAVEHTALSDGLIAAAHGRGMDVVAWTVNERAELAALIARGVDAVASDRPDRGRAVLAARGLPLPAPAAAPPSPATPRPAP